MDHRVGEEMDSLRMNEKLREFSCGKCFGKTEEVCFRKKGCQGYLFGHVFGDDLAKGVPSHHWTNLRSRDLRPSGELCPTLVE